MKGGVKDYWTHFMVTLQTHKYWSIAILLTVLNFFIVSFGPLASLYITPFEGSPIVIPAGLLYAGMLFSTFIAGKDLFQSRTAGVVSLLLFSLLLPFFLQLFVAENILFFVEILFLNLSFAALHQVFHTNCKRGWFSLGLLTVLITFTHMATAIVYLTSLLFSFTYLAIAANRERILRNALMYVGPPTVLWLGVLFLIGLRVDSFSFVSSNAFAQFGSSLLSKISMIPLQFLVVGGLFGFLYVLFEPPAKEKITGLKVMVIWFLSILVGGVATLFFPIKGIVYQFPYYVLLILTFVFSLTVIEAVTSLQQKEERRKEKPKVKQAEIPSIQFEGKTVPLLILTLFLSFTIMSFESRTWSLTPLAVRGDKFYAHSFGEGNHPEEEDPPLGFGEDFSDISDWNVSGDHKQPPETDGDKVKMWVQDNGDPAWDYARLVYNFGPKGLDLSTYPMLSVRITNFTETSNDGHFKLYFRDQGYGYKDIPIVMTEQEELGIFYLNLYAFTQRYGLKPTLQQMKLLTVTKTNHDSAMTEIDWIRIYGITGYSFESKNLASGWRDWINAYMVTASGGNILLHTTFNRHGTLEYAGIKKEGLQIATKYYIAIKYKTGDLETGVTITLETDASTESHVMQPSTQWATFRGRLSTLVDGSTLRTCSLRLVDDYSSISSLSGTHSLSIDWIKIGTKGKVITLFDT